MTEPAAEARAMPQPAVGARVLRELLRTPAFRQIFLSNLDAADPEAARDVVRTLLRDDPNFSLSLAASAPRLFNALVEALLEAGRQILTFTPELLDEFTKNLAEEVDVDRLRQLPALYAPLVQRTLAQRGVRLDGAAAGRALSHAARSVSKSLAANPQYLRDFAANLDFGALARAAWRFGCAVCGELTRRCFGAVKRLFGRQEGKRDV